MFTSHDWEWIAHSTSKNGGFSWGKWCSSPLEMDAAFDPPKNHRWPIWRIFTMVCNVVVWWLTM
jgi:hypothetical protein